MGNIWRDLRHAGRSLRKRASFTVMVVAILGLGLASTTCIYLVVDALVLQPLKFEDPNQLVHIESSMPKRAVPSFAISPPEYLDYLEQNRVFEDIALYSGETETFNLRREDEPERLPGRRVSANFFEVLGVRPAMGRAFLPTEQGPGTPPVLILSDGFWRREYGADPNVIGMQTALDDLPYTIIGILPPGVRFLTSEIEVWLPLEIELATQPRTRRRFRAVGRLSEGLTLEQARSDMVSIATRLEQEHPETNTGFEARVTPLHEFILGEEFSLTWQVAMVSVVSLLMISCANVASLLLIQGTVRFRELAMRSTLGASRLQILRLFFAESAILAGLGAAVALGLTYFGGLSLVKLLIPNGLPMAENITLGVQGLLFVGLLTMTTAMLCGSLPAVLLTLRTNPAAVSREGGRTGTGRTVNAARTGLVILQVALAFCLLVAAGVVMKSFWQLQQVDRGLRAENVLALRMTVPARKYPEEVRIIAHLQQIVDRVKQLPGVLSAAVINELPATKYINWAAYYTVEGQPPPPAGQEPICQLRIAGPDYFRTMGIRLLQGREFSESDRREDPEVVLVNNLLAKTHFPDEDPVGKFLQIRGRPGPSQIIGVVSDVRQRGPRDPIRPAVYESFTQRPNSTTSIVIRTDSNPSGLTSTLRSTVAEVDPGQAIYSIETLQQALSDDVAREQTLSRILGVLVLAAVLLAAAGLYGVVAYTMTQRTREIGIRGALGASKREIAQLVVRRGLTLTAIGLAAGLGLAVLANPLLEPLLFEVDSLDLQVTGGVIAILVVVSLMAMYFPSRRAVSIDPAKALRFD